jgi:hypothetical protein
MTPQSQFFVIAPIAPGREAELRARLERMTVVPGHARPDDPAMPWAALDTIHFARLLILDDQTLGDAAVYGRPRANHPLSLAFAGEVDGDLDDFFVAVARRGAPGLTALFGCCDGFAPGDDLAGWLKRHHVPAAASYINWLGRTVRQVREEAALFAAVQRHLRAEWLALRDQPAAKVHARLRALVCDDVQAGRLTMSPEPPTPLGWKLRRLAHLIGVPLGLLVLSPIVVPLALAGVLVLRRQEQTDPEVCPRTDPAHAAALAAVEDFDVTNSFSAMGSLKPGLARRWAAIALLSAIDFFARHVYTRGRLARVRTIHFARWVFLDGKTRVIFLSNYDGSLESYMDDFINKVGFGLNLSFSHGIGFPRTRWLAFEGSSDERKFKEYLRRHQMPTQVWYQAYPGLTAVDLERHTLVRRGLEVASLGGRQAETWAELL